MKIYKTTRKVEEIEIDDEEFLAYLKKKDPEDEAIQNAQSLDDVFAEYWISEFGEEFDECAKETCEHDSHSGYYLDYDEAYQDMEFGIH